MLRAGRELIDAQGGLRVSLDHLPLEEVIDRADVARSSVFRLWADREDFQADLFADIVGENWIGVAAFDLAVFDWVGHLIDANQHLLDTAGGRRWLLLEACRYAGDAILQSTVSNEKWRTSIALAAVVTSDDPTRFDPVKRPLAEADRAFVDETSLRIDVLTTIAGLRHRPGVTSTSTVTLAITSLLEGLALQSLAVPCAVGRRVALAGLDGPIEWPLAGIGLVGLIDQFYEPTDDFDLDRARRLLGLAMAAVAPPTEPVPVITPPPAGTDWPDSPLMHRAVRRVMATPP